MSGVIDANSSGSFLAWKMSEQVDVVFSATSQLLTKFIAMTLERERLAAVIDERKRFLASSLYSEKDDFSSFDSKSPTDKFKVCVNAGAQTVDDGQPIQTKLDILKQRERLAEQGKERDPDVEKTIDLLVSIRDLLSSYGVPSSQDSASRERKRHHGGLKANKKEGRAGDGYPRIPAHIKVLKSLGFDTSEIKQQEEEKELEKQRQRRVLLGDDSDDENEKEKKEEDMWKPVPFVTSMFSPNDLLLLDENHNNKNKNNSGYPSLPSSSSSSSLSDVANKSRMLPLVSALQFQAASAALGDYESRLRNQILLEASVMGWRFYHYALADVSDRSLYCDYIAAKKHHSLSISPCRGDEGWDQFRNYHRNNDYYPPTSSAAPPALAAAAAAAAGNPNSNNPNTYQQAKQQYLPSQGNQYQPQFQPQLQHQQQQQQPTAAASGVVMTPRNNNQQQQQQTSSQPAAAAGTTPRTATPLSEHDRKVALFHQRKGKTPPRNSPQHQHQQGQQPHEKTQRQTPDIQKEQDLYYSQPRHQQNLSPQQQRQFDLYQQQHQDQQQDQTPQPQGQGGTRNSNSNTRRPTTPNSNSSGPISAAWAGTVGLELSSQLAVLRQEVMRHPTPRSSHHHNANNNSSENSSDDPFHRKYSSSTSPKRNSTTSSSRGGRSSPQQQNSKKKKIILDSSDEEEDLLEEFGQEGENYDELLAAARKKITPRRSRTAADAISSLKRNKPATTGGDSPDNNNNFHGISLRDTRVGSNRKKSLAQLQAEVTAATCGSALMSWMQISDGDVRLSWTRRFLRWDPAKFTIHASAREAAIGKILLKLIPDENNSYSSSSTSSSGFVNAPYVHKVDLKKHAHIVSPFTFPSKANSFYLLNVSHESLSSGSSLLEPPDSRQSSNGVVLTLQSFYKSDDLCTVIFCAESHIHAQMWVAVLRDLQVQSEVL